MNGTQSQRMFAVLFIAALALTGCGRAPNAPIVSSSSVISGGASSGIYEDPTEPGGNDTPTPAFVSTSAVIMGKSGGTLVAGSFKLTIPKNAFSGKETVTMRQDDLSVLAVEISVSPAMTKKLKVPATLTADASALTASDLSQSAIWSWSASSGSYQLVSGSSVDLAGKKVQAPLKTLAASKVQKS